MKILYPQNQQGRELAALIENLEMQMQNVNPNHTNFVVLHNKMKTLCDLRDSCCSAAKLEQFMNENKEKYKVRLQL